MSELPDPLTPPDCDLRDFQFMPIDIVRLFGSRFHAVASDIEWRAGITLWLKSFHQVPAASIPDDDVELARLAELGRDLKTWKKIRGGTLYGWVKCSDGRFYHPVVAEKANEAYAKKEFYRERSKKANAKRWNGLDNPEKPACDEGTETAKKDAASKNGEGVSQASKKESFKDDQSYPSASQGTVRVKREEESPPKSPNNFRVERDALRQKIRDLAQFTHEPSDWHLLDEWIAAGAVMNQDILPIVERESDQLMARRGNRPFKLKFFDDAIRRKLAADQAEIERLANITRRIQQQDEEQSRPEATH